MVAVDDATAGELLSRPISDDDETHRRIRQTLMRSLVAEGISDDLIATLEEIFTDRNPAVPKRRLDGLLARMGLPLPRRRPPAAAPPLSQEDAARITSRFRRATQQLMQVAPHRTWWYPTEELRRLSALHDEQPAEGEELSYLRRYALAITALLELMGDDA